MSSPFTLLGNAEPKSKENQTPSIQEAAENALKGLHRQLVAQSSIEAAGWSLARPSTSLPLSILRRQLVGGSSGSRINLGQRFPLATSLACSIDDHHSAAIFCGKFSGDGTVFATASQDASIRIYTTNNLIYHSQVVRERRAQLEREGRPMSMREASPCSMQPYKVIPARDVGWSIIDSDFSRDKRFVAYTSWSRYIHMASVDLDQEKHEAFEVSRPRRHEWSHHFCLFSIQFSDSSDQIVGGANDGHLYLYNLGRNSVQNRIHAHADDINTVIFAERHTSNILLSGSDDAIVKLWDLRASGGARGLLAGHAAGITSIASKGDGYHFLSNSKDNTCKLWDLRVMADANPEAVELAQVLDQPDYRGAHFRSRYRVPRSVPRGRDLSLQTFSGHHVTRTLIRCCFTPEETTGGRGSSDGRILLWDTLNCQEVKREGDAELGFHAAPVRDLAFHPSLPLLVSSSWDRRLGIWHFGGGEEGRDDE